MGRPRRISIAVGLLCLVMAGTWYAHYKWERRYFVPVGVPTSLNRYDDDTPVTSAASEWAESNALQKASTAASGFFLCENELKSNENRNRNLSRGSPKESLLGLSGGATVTATGM